jgi:hypothetical protein
VHQGGPPGVAEQLGDALGAVAHDDARLVGIIAGQGARHHMAVGADDVDRVAAGEGALDGGDAGGSSDLPRARAAAAPASTAMRPRGFMPEIQRLRASAGSPCGANQVQGAPASSAAIGFATSRLRIAMAQPARAAALAAISLVAMPPRECAVPAPPAIASIGG